MEMTNGGKDDEVLGEKVSGMRGEVADLVIKRAWIVKGVWKEFKVRWDSEV